MGSRSVHALVCTTDGVVVEAMRRALDDGGHRITVCENGLELLGAVRAVAADVLILDVEAPGLNGLLLVSALKELAPGLPIVAVSTRGEIRDARALSQRGVACYTMAATPDGPAPPLLAELAHVGG
jgi:two-component system response regulator PrrA